MRDRRLIDVLVLVAGALLPLAFEPFALWWLIFPVLIILLWSWLDVSPARAALRGLLFGVGSFGVGTSWVYVSLSKFGGMAPPLAFAAVLLFVLGLAAFIAFAGWLTRRLHGPGWSWRLLALAPAVWIGSEWLRSLWVVSFPWLSVGYSQSNSSLAGIAAIGGVYALGFVVMLLVVLGVGIVVGPTPRRIGGAIAIVGIIAIALAVDSIEWVAPNGDQINVAMVQANVPIEQKWQVDQTDVIRQAYIDLSEPLKDSKIIIWPEAAIPDFIDELKDEFWAKLDKHPASFVFGAVERREQDGRLIMHNSAVIATPQQPLRYYRKDHLVAFGEYVPLGNWLRTFVEYMAIPMADFRPWPEPQGSYLVDGTQVGVSICYEDSFPEDVRRALPDAGVLINISEDAWFGDSFGPHQRLQMGSIRAIENGRPMLRSSNTGVTAVLDHRGRVVKRAPQFERVVLTATLQPFAGVTPFVRFGSWPTLILCAAILVLGLFAAPGSIARQIAN